MTNLAPEADTVQNSRVPAMRIKRKVVGGIAVVGILIGAWLSGLFTGFGSGSGDGTGDGTETVVSTDPSTATPSTPTETPAAETPASETPAETPAAATTPEAGSEKPVTIELLDVYVDDRSYAVPLRAGGHRKVNLPLILTLARQTTGNDEGLRIRILRTPSARLLAWSTLSDALQREAGVPRDAIDIPEKLVELPQATEEESSEATES